MRGLNKIWGKPTQIGNQIEYLNTKLWNKNSWHKVKSWWINILFQTNYYEFKICLIIWISNIWVIFYVECSQQQKQTKDCWHLPLPGQKWRERIYLVRQHKVSMKVWSNLPFNVRLLVPIYWLLFSLKYVPLFRDRTWLPNWLPVECTDKLWKGGRQHQKWENINIIFTIYI